MCCSGDIRARAEASAIGRKWRRHWRSQEDDHSLTFDPMNSACASKIRPRSDLPFLRNARTDGHTDRQTDRQSFSLVEILCDWDSRVA